MEFKIPSYLKSSRLKNLFNHVKNNYSSSCKAHGFDHIKRVLDNISVIISDLDINEDIIFAAGLMHDYTREPDRISKKHAKINAEIIKKLLPDYGFNYDEIEVIETAVREHDNKEDIERSIYSTILFEADKLDTFGEEGFNRWLILGSGDGLSRSETIEGILKIQFRFLNQYNFKLDVSKKLLKEKAKILFKLMKDEIGAERYYYLIKKYGGERFTSFLDKND